MNGNPEDITIISSGVKLEGKMTSDGSIRVDGDILGDVICKGNITIGETGNVKGQISADMIIIGGHVNGSVNAREKLVLEAKANLKGDIISKILMIEAGARFDGKSSMGADSKDSFKSSSPLQSNETGPK